MEKPVPDHFFSGTSGLQVPIPKYLFPAPYENASRLTYYASLFNSLEVNSSFYKIPQKATVAKWGLSVHEEFKFSFKLWQGITHCKEFDFKEADVQHFFSAINAVEDKRGCILIQFPPSVGIEYLLQLNKLLRCIESDSAGWKIAVEFRNRSWYNDPTYSLLDHYHAALVIQDIPKSATPAREHTSEFVYMRFHGPTGNYRDSYPESFLSDQAERVNEWIGEGKEVYVYFNNTIGDALNNLKTMNRLLNVRKRNHHRLMK